MPPPPDELPPSDDPTTRWVRQALRGDRESLDWVVARLSPLLKAQVAYRMGPMLRKRMEVEDVVAEAWLVALRRLDDVVPDEGRYTPRLLAFLSATAGRIINHALDQLIRRKEVSGAGPASGGGDQAIAQQAADITSAMTRAVRGELGLAIERCLEELSEKDREVIILRGIEGRSNQEAAQEFQEPPDTVSHRYRRALEKLRRAMPKTVFDELLEA